MQQGSCLCTRVSYQFKSMGDIVHCHCQTCRKAHGSAFSSVASVNDTDFILEGSENLNRFESSPGKFRYFCRDCGSQIYAKREGTSHIILRLGTLNTIPCAKEKSHIWLSQKAPWYKLHSKIKEHEGF